MCFLRILITFPEELRCRRGFYETTVSVKHLSVNFSAFCVPCELETLNLSGFFFKVFIFSTFKGPIMLHGAGTGTPLSCDYAVSSFLNIFIIYGKILQEHCTILVSRDTLEFHID